MLVTALGASDRLRQGLEIAHYALDHDLTLREAALELKLIGADDFDRIVDPAT